MRRRLRARIHRTPSWTVGAGKVHTTTCAVAAIISDATAKLLQTLPQVVSQRTHLARNTLVSSVRNWTNTQQTLRRRRSTLHFVGRLSWPFRVKRVDVLGNCLNLLGKTSNQQCAMREHDLKRNAPDVFTRRPSHRVGLGGSSGLFGTDSKVKTYFLCCFSVFSWFWDPFWGQLRVQMAPVGGVRWAYELAWTQRGCDNQEVQNRIKWRATLSTSVQSDNCASTIYTCGRQFKSKNLILFVFVQFFQCFLCFWTLLETNSKLNFNFGLFSVYVSSLLIYPLTKNVEIFIYFIICKDIWLFWVFTFLFEFQWRQKLKTQNKKCLSVVWKPYFRYVFFKKNKKLLPYFSNLKVRFLFTFAIISKFFFVFCFLFLVLLKETQKTRVLGGWVRWFGGSVLGRVVLCWVLGLFILSDLKVDTLLPAVCYWMMWGSCLREPRTGEPHPRSDDTEVAAGVWRAR